MNIGTSTQISFEALLNPSDPQKSNADVILWMGTDKEPIYAHSCILKNASDYYMTALSSRWNKVNKGGFTSIAVKDGEGMASDAVFNKDVPPSVTSTDFTACPTLKEDCTISNSADSYIRFEIHHPEFEKRHMIQVLYYMYRVPTVIKTEDVLDVALIANHLLMSELQNQCLSYIADTAKNVDQCALKLYLLAATTFLGSSNSKFMALALEVICQSFDSCISVIPDLALLGKREIEALIVGLPLTAKQKWILLIVWAMASTGMMEDSCETPLQYAFNESNWKKKSSKSFKEAVQGIVHLIPFPELSRSDYVTYVHPFQDSGVLKANLEDFLIHSFETFKESNVQDPQLLATVKQQEPFIHVLNMLKSFPTPLPKIMNEYIHEKVFSCRGRLWARVQLEAQPKSYTVYKDEKIVRKLTSCSTAPFRVHVFATTNGWLAVVIVVADEKTDYIIYQRQGIYEHTCMTQRHDHYSCINGSLICKCGLQSDYVEEVYSGRRSWRNSGRVKYPLVLKDEAIKDYVICFIG